MDKQVAAFDILTLNQIIEKLFRLTRRHWRPELAIHFAIAAIILYQNLENIVCSDVESLIDESIESISHYTE